MNAYQRKQKQKKRKSLFRKWHRRLGLAVCLLLVHLAVTGVLLNHYDWFDLHKSHLKSSWLLDWYDIKAPAESHCAAIKNVKICQLGERLYWLSKSPTAEPKLLHTQTSPLITAFELEQMLVTVTDSQLFLFSLQGELIEQIDLFDKLKYPILQAAPIDEQVYLRVGNFGYWFDLDNYQLAEVRQPVSLFPARLRPATDDELSKLQTLYRQAQISHLKLIQDLHSGSFFFSNGKVLTDLLALSILLLAVSGIIAWQRRVQRERQ